MKTVSKPANTLFYLSSSRDHQATVVDKALIKNETGNLFISSNLNPFDFEIRDCIPSHQNK